MNSKKGKLIVFSGPSGVGKGTLLKEVLKSNDNVVLSISATTRQPREGEQDGVQYYFLSKEKFTDMIDHDKLLEYAQYCDNFYGTPADKVDEWINEGKIVILEIETEGAFKVKSKRPDACLIFIMPPSMEVLRHRIEYADTGVRNNIEDRMKKAELEIERSKDYDHIVVNGPLEEAVAELTDIIFK